MEFKIINGDSFEILKQQPDNSFDSVVTDPPYGLGFMGKEWDKPENIAFNHEFWAEVLRVLKPGGHLLAFSGSRTYHRMAIAIEDAGFEIRDQIMWLYGSGFPKSQNLGKAIDKKLGATPIDTGIVQPNWLNKDGSITKRNIVGASEDIGHSYGFQNAPTITKPGSEEGQQWEGWGSALKPAHEPIVMARKPFKGTLVNNVLVNGVGGINIDESRVGNEKTITIGVDMSKDQESFFRGMHKINKENEGRFPANVIHDGSEEVNNAFPQESQRFFYGSKCSKADRNEGLEEFPLKEKIFNGKSSTPSSEPKDVEKRMMAQPRQNNHPTVKPTDLMAYLVRLVTPQGGKVLDPFNGSGSTGKAVAYLNKTENKNYSYIGMELDPEYIKISQARIQYTMNNETWLEKKKSV